MSVKYIVMSMSREQLYMDAEGRRGGRVFVGVVFEPESKT